MARSDYSDETLPRYPRIRWRTLLLGLIGAGIVHIVATLVWPQFSGGSGALRIAATLEAGQMTVLPPLSPKTQLVPFQAPDFSYAACRIDVSEAAYAVRATLPEPGWTLSIHNMAGDTVYVVTGQEQRSTNIALLVLPPGDRFVGVLPEARLAAGFAQVSMPSPQGIVLLRAPNKGAAYQSQVDADLAKATCVARKP